MQFTATGLRCFDTALRTGVALALLRTQDAATAMENGLVNGWVAPVSYAAVHEVLRGFAQDGPAGTGRGAGLTAPLWALLGAVVALGLAALLTRKPLAETPLGPGTEDDGAEHEPLTPREQEILDLISDGCSTKEIAARLEISPKTVEFHRSNLLRKYGARSSLELVKLAS